MSGPGRRGLVATDPTIGERAAALYLQLGSMEKVAVHLGCGSTTVSRLIRARGIEPTPSWRAERNTADAHVACACCGIDREVNMSRGYSPYCVACKVELAAGRVQASCGTAAGIERHREFGHPLCIPCRRALTDYVSTQPTGGYEPEPVPIEEWSGPPPVIEWRRGPAGILRGIVRFDPPLDEMDQTAATESRQEVAA